MVRGATAAFVLISPFIGASSFAQGSFKPVDGYRSISLGSTFEDAVGSLDNSLFNPSSLRDCFRDLALFGCNLFPADEDVRWEMRDGMPYTLGLFFNRHDKLTDIELTFNRIGGVVARQCRDLTSRTVDWVAADYGPMTYLYEGIAEPPADKQPMMLMTSPGDNAVAFIRPLPDGGFVSRFMHPSGEPHEIRGSGDKRHYVVTGRSVSVFANFIVLKPAKAACHITVKISEPDDVERPDNSGK